jgi:hypothetical protein
MEGKLMCWDHPPELDSITGHAGELLNHHCFPDIVIPDRL